MSLIAAERLSKKFSDQLILDQVSFTINAGERVALVGKNGMGKTTLLEILANKQEPDTGTFNRSKSLIIDYVEQEKTEYLDWTLEAFVADARRDLIEYRARITELEHHLADHPHDQKALDELGHLSHEFEKGGGFDFENELKIILTGLGFEESRMTEKLRNFSGGEKNRAGLARVLAGRGSLLLLDEPTNHLDIESTIWLEQYLASLNKSCLIVSHDRTFLQNTVQSVWELTLGKLDIYSMSFERFLTERTLRRRQAEQEYKMQREEIARAEDFIRRNMAGQKTKQAQSKLKYLNKLKRLPPPKQDGKGPTISIESSGRSFAHVLEVQNVTLGYGDRTILKTVQFDLYRGDKIGLIGRNGSGKSTLLKSLTGEVEPTNGSVRLGNNLDVAYFDQELSDLDQSMLMIDSLWEKDPMADVGSIRSYLARFGLVGEDALKPISALSGGEKTKLSLARLFYHPANFIILDEPTNHLDIFAREALENAIKEYDGTCVIVSHDRAFLSAVAERILHVHDAKVTVYNGSYQYFVDKQAARSTSTKQPGARSGESRKHVEDFKAESKRQAKQKKELQSLQSKLSSVEKELSELDLLLRSGISPNDWELLHKTSQRKRELEDQALELYAALEQLNEGRDA